LDKAIHTIAIRSKMDLLKAEIERKRKGIELAKSSSSSAIIKVKNGKKVYLRASELRRFQQDMEVENKGNDRNDVQEKPPQRELNVLEEKKIDESKEDKEKKKCNESVISLKNVRNELSPLEITSNLRALGLPIRLFGERTILLDSRNLYDDSDRLDRLDAANELTSQALAGINENEEFRLNKGHRIRNTFLGGKKNEIIQTKPLEAIQNTQESTKKLDESLKEDNDNDPHKRIHRFLKSLLKHWEEELQQRPDAVTKTVAGKKDTHTLEQCRDYIRPLFKRCKKRNLEPFILNHLEKIVQYCEEGEFVKANDAYVNIAIGRAAWPIGVTMVGIHARSGRAKIESANVAHVMNSELQRKYLTSVKRLISYAQKIRPDVDPSKKVLF